MTHTPGPWKVVGREQVWIPENDGTTIIVVDPDNAALIAASPELLEACEAVKEWLTFNRKITGTEKQFWNEAFIKANNKVIAAFAKAKGEGT